MPSVAFLKEFADAWNRHDLDTLMEHMAEDGVFISSSGSKAQGRIAVHEAFPDARWDSDVHFVSGNRGVSEWIFSGIDKENGTRV